MVQQVPARYTTNPKKLEGKPERETTYIERYVYIAQNLLIREANGFSSSKESGPRKTLPGFTPAVKRNR